MTIIVRDAANTAREITAIQVRDAANTPRDISEVFVRDSNNVSRRVFPSYPPLSASAVPEFVGGFSSGSPAVTTNATTVTRTGGLAPYTYAWTVISHTNVTTPIINSPTSATTTFTQPNVSALTPSEAEFRCTVTDSLSNTAAAHVGASFEFQP